MSADEWKLLAEAYQREAVKQKERAEWSNNARRKLLHMAHRYMTAKNEAETRTKLAEEKLYGPACPNEECPDYDGAHPFHDNVVERFWREKQKEYVPRSELARVTGLWKKAENDLTIALDAADRIIVANERLEAALKAERERCAAVVREECVNGCDLCGADADEAVRRILGGEE